MNAGELGKRRREEESRDKNPSLPKDSRPSADDPSPPPVAPPDPAPDVPAPLTGVTAEPALFDDSLLPPLVWTEEDDAWLASLDTNPTPMLHEPGEEVLTTSITQPDPVGASIAEKNKEADEEEEEPPGVLVPVPDNPKEEIPDPAPLATPQEQYLLRRVQRAYALAHANFKTRQVRAVKACTVTSEPDVIDRECAAKIRKLTDAKRIVTALANVPLEDLIASVTYYKNSIRAVKVLDPDKTVMASGTHFSASGGTYKLPMSKREEAWKTAVGTQATLVFIDGPEVAKLCTEALGYKCENPQNFYGYHADKQLVLHCIKEGVPIGALGDSRIMCLDCQEFFYRVAEVQQQVIVVTDPSATKIFFPRGESVTVFHSPTFGSFSMDDLVYREPNTGDDTAWFDQTETRGKLWYNKDAKKLWPKYHAVCESRDGQSTCYGTDWSSTTIPAADKYK